MPRIETGAAIDYRHIIASLVRKPGAFAQYQYRQWLFPHPLFRQAFDELVKASPAGGHKVYLHLLQLAKRYGEREVLAALEICKETHQLPESSTVSGYLQAPLLPKIQVHVLQPNLGLYDELHGFGGQAC